MTTTLELTVRVVCFAVVLAGMAAWEALAPRRPLIADKPRRWLSNLSLAALNTLVVRMFAPLTAVGMALFAEERQWGLLNQFSLATWGKCVLAVVALDLAIYLQHVLFHAVPVLWKLHLVHHADLDFDLTTGLRFHTIEIVLSLMIKWGAIVALGPPSWAVMIFEVLLNGTSMFNHGNVRLPLKLDRVLRLLVVTPEMHRVHHSTVPEETNSNFGFNLPWWDYLLGTYRAQPAAGHEAMQVGVAHVRNERQADRLPGMLALPFRSGTGEYNICGRNRYASDP